jgi:hypothetical protein
MKARHLISVGAVALFTIACGYSIKTSTDYDRNVRFSNYQSFFIVKGNSSGNPLMDQRAQDGDFKVGTPGRRQPRAGRVARGLSQRRDFERYWSGSSSRPMAGRRLNEALVLHRRDRGTPSAGSERRGSRRC